VSNLSNHSPDPPPDDPSQRAGHAPVPLTALSASRSIRLVVVVVALPGVAALLLAVLPASLITTAAERFGHADDVSADRIARLRIVSGLLAATHLACAGFLGTAGRRAALKFVSQTRAEVEAVRVTASVRYAARSFMEPGWLHAITWLVVAGVALSIRLAYWRVPMDYDESYSFLNYARRPLYQGLADYSSTNNHLLNTVGMHVGYLAFGQQEWVLRWHVLVAGLGAVATIYVLGRSCAGPDVGLVAAAFAATSFMMVNYSVNARGYIWAAWMTALLMFAFWRISTATPSLLADWMGAAWAAVLGLFAVPTMLYAIAGCVAWLALSAVRPAESRRGTWMALGAWCLVVGLVTAWLYAPAFVFQGMHAWRHPFVQAQDFGVWIEHFPAACMLAVRSWAEGPIPWWVSGVLAAVGFVGLFLYHRAGAWLVLSMFATPAALMFLQRVAPPPRILSLLAPAFFVAAASGVVSLVRWAARPDRLARDTVPARNESALCSWIACAVVAWGHYQAKHQPLPGGARPAYLVENVQDAWSAGWFGTLPGPTQWWRLDVKEAVEKVEGELKPGDRVLVGLPIDLPFRFYAARRHWQANIGGDPQPQERIFLVIRAAERPVTALRENLSLRLESPWLLAARWQLLAAGELAIWMAEPDPPEPTSSTAP
jgi:hypothetical protein